MTSIAEIEQRLDQAAADLRQLEKLRLDREATMKSLRSASDEAGVLEAKMDNVVADMEEGGFREWLSNLFGGDNDPDPREAEVAALRLRRDAALRVVEGLRGEVAAYEEQAKALGAVAARQRDALEAKERLLIEAGDENGRKLAGIAARRADATAKVKEYGEAIKAGQYLLGDLSNLNEALSKAGRMGLLDTLGGGTLTTVVKHERIDDARDIAASLQRSILAFDRELQDVGRRRSGVGVANVDIGTGLQFADFLLDGLIADMMVQSRLNDARMSVTVASGNLQSDIEDLRAELAVAKEALAAAETERSTLLGVTPS
jgi:hypothetical protein